MKTSTDAVRVGTPSAPRDMDTPVVLDVNDLRTHFTMPGGTVRAVDGVSYRLHRGRTLGIVGESGCGKSVTAQSILGIVPRPGKVVSGSMVLTRSDGSSLELAGLDPKGKVIRSVRGNEIAYIFQEPMSALSPIHTIGHQITEVIRLHTGANRDQARERAETVMRQVGLPRPDEVLGRYPHQLSGGMRQRAVIGIALACSPSILIADEPTTALDVTTEAVILDLVRSLQDTTGMAIQFITHNLGVIAEIADEVVVMYMGGSLMTTNIPVQSGTAPAGAVDGDLLVVRDLVKHFPIRKGFWSKIVGQVRAVDGVSFNVRQGETLGLVGESGCGKTTTSRMVMRAYQPTGGTIYFRDRTQGWLDIPTASANQVSGIRRNLQMIFQDPYSSLNPRMTLLDIIGEPLMVNGVAKGSELQDRVAELLRLVGLHPEYMARYPHAFSGGQRQRVGIARAIALEPQLVVCDEPVSALDVSIQAQTLNLLEDLQARLGLTYIFVAHDLSVVQHVSTRVAVMYVGRIVECAPTEDLFFSPKHPYTEALLSAVPTPDPTRRGSRIFLAGEVPDASNPPPGCHFHPRCRYAADICRTTVPPLTEIAPGHTVACHMSDQLSLTGVHA
ncbi:MAG: ABC transporter ATP-binding protein [Proteobacteria bacterium]|nr:ABC transporter ATP-binding protein [Pseudomonadota bacterium]